MGPTDAASDPLLPSSPEPSSTPATPWQGDNESAPRIGPVPAELIPAPAPDLGGMIES
jgi:hypothetical protein